MVIGMYSHPTNNRCSLLHTDPMPIAVGSQYGYKSPCVPTLPVDRDRGDAIHQLERRHADLPSVQSQLERRPRFHGA